MLKFAKDNGNGVVEIGSKFWWAVKVLITFCIGLSIFAFAWGSRSGIWTTNIARNRSDIKELKIENKEQDVRLNDIGETVIRIDERTIIMKEAIERIEHKFEE